ncbi:MAG: hypothetical protein ABIH03_12315 [Pseudomonadota bacterium]
MEVTKESLEKEIQALRANQQQAVVARDNASALILKYAGALEQAERTLAVLNAKPEPEKAEKKTFRARPGKETDGAKIPEV